MTNLIEKQSVKRVLRILKDFDKSLEVTVLDSSARKEFNENFIKAKSLLDLYK